MSPTLIPDPAQLQLDCLTASATAITMVVSTKAATAPCPLCQRPSGRRHSRYQRMLADLPWNGITVQIRLQTRRFFCDNDACQRRIFTERVPAVAAPYARRTTRLAEWLTHVAFALGGLPGARLLRHGGCAVSRQTLLRLIHAFPGVAAPTPRVLSVDDFAFRKGRTYGTILVDLERHQVIDLLPDRSAEGVAEWLMAQPGVEIVSRDRGGEYAEGAKRGAPGAVQVADRFHLLRNAGDVARRVLQRHAAVVQRVPAPGPSTYRLSRLRLDREATRERTAEAMRERWTQIHARAGEGLSKEAIAERLGLNRKTVYKYLALTAPPTRRHGWRQESALAPYEGYLLRRWAEGCRKARRLWREIQAQGYPGAYQNVVRITGYLRHQERQGKRAPPAPAGLTPRQAVGLVLLRGEDRSTEERQTVEQVRTLEPDIRQAVALLEGFAQLIRDSPHERPAERLDQWIGAVGASGLPEFEAFVIKLRQDLDAVLAGLRLPWSQGQTEGQITKLKLLKRSMYGRGSFDLLKQRVLYASAVA
ncbi:MAG TPA: ISL3 family transposase [Actinomycetota bacterium]|nr:ISL3 family transposase [Actinomycetota bacterium]